MIYTDFPVEKLALSGNRWKPLYYGLFGDLGHKYLVCQIYRGMTQGLIYSTISIPTRPTNSISLRGSSRSFSVSLMCVASTESCLSVGSNARH